MSLGYLMMGAFSNASGPEVSALADGDYNYRYNAICYVGVQFNSDGEEYERTATGGYTATVGTWLDAGTPDQVWVEYINNTGTFTGKTANTRYTMASSIDFYKTVLYDIQTVTCQFRFWDAASGGNTLQTTASASWTAESEAAGGCPLCCFTPDTLILMADGTEVPIGEIQPGDEIQGEICAEVVTGIIIRENRPMYELLFSDDTTLRLSDDHPIYVDAQGYSAINPQIPYKDMGLAQTLQLGQFVKGSDGGLKMIMAIRQIEYPGEVYTLENSRFYANGILVY